MKVIYNVDELEKWQKFIANVKNMLSYAQENNELFEIDVLSNSIAVTDLKKESDIEHDILFMIDNGVTFVACQNSLNAQSLSSHQLIFGVFVVRAGVVELAVKQNQGFAYIKP